ncbi:MFS transporter [Rhizobium puerariae]|uniref:MFS transporter n=1 Tax=Rhizobium puerariae TaxID=1585791 RepID=A0ABV6AF01_9HYPH
MQKPETRRTPGSPEKAAPLPPNSRKLMTAVFPPLFIGMIDQTIVATALPSMVHDLGGLDRMPLVVVAYLAATAISAPVYGRLGDAFGRRNMLGLSLLMTIAGSFLCALAPTFSMLVAARVVQGLGGGGIISLSYALVAQWSTLERRARYQGYLATIAMVSSALGPPLGGTITALAGWRWIFVLNIPVGLLAIFLIFRLPPRLKPRDAMAFDFVGLLLFTAFTAALITLIERTKSGAITATPNLLLTAFGILVLAILLMQQPRAGDPLFPPLLFRMPAVLLSNILAMAHGALYVSLLTFAPAFFALARGVDVQDLGLYMLPVTFGTGAGALITGRLISATGRTTIFPITGLAAIAMLLCFLCLKGEHLSNWEISAAFTAIYVFMGTTMAVVQLTVQAEVGPARLGIGTATTMVARSFGASAGTAAAGVMLAEALAGRDLATVDRAVVEQAFQTVFAAVAAFALFATAVAAAIPRRRLQTGQRG